MRGIVVTILLLSIVIRTTSAAPIIGGVAASGVRSFAQSFTPPHRLLGSTAAAPLQGGARPFCGMGGPTGPCTREGSPSTPKPAHRKPRPASNAADPGLQPLSRRGRRGGAKEEEAGLAEPLGQEEGEASPARGRLGLRVSS